MIIKAKVITNSSSDPDGKGRVKLESPGIWENSSESGDYYPVCSNTPLNKGDVVFVYLQDVFDLANPLVLGRCRDNNFKSNADVPTTFSVLWESVSADGSTWSVAYTEGDEFWFENNKGLVFGSSGENIQFHSGDNGGLINIEYLNSFIQAVLTDLTLVGSGSNVSKWLASDALKLEDSTIIH